MVDEQNLLEVSLLCVLFLVPMVIIGWQVQQINRELRKAILREIDKDKPSR